nr:glycosyltransferase [Ramlibacter lithotrophicus]
MARELLLWYGGEPVERPTVRVFPFADHQPIEVPGDARDPEWDFVYVADGEAHKNHRTLLEAWRELATQGLKPRLALTLGPRDAALARAVDALRTRTGAEVYNLGQMSHHQILLLYRRSRALIFPSLLESFGLPLIEAEQISLPILAPERDYVRDVCTPAQTFDATSAHSIASAVRRFLDQAHPAIVPYSPADFWEALLDGVPKDS